MYTSFTLIQQGPMHFYTFIAIEPLFQMHNAKSSLRKYMFILKSLHLETSLLD